MILLYVFDGIIVLTAGYMCYSSFFHKNIIHKKYISDNKVEQINSNYLSFHDNENEIEALV